MKIEYEQTYVPGVIMENKMTKMYDLVFQDMVRCYCEELEYADEYDDDKPILSESEIKEIAYKMIYKNEYLWEVINDTIDVYIGQIKESE